jgi:hypothetical protein
MKPITTADVEALTPANVLRGTDGWEPSRVPSFPATRKAAAGVE